MESPPTKLLVNFLIVRWNFLRVEKPSVTTEREFILVGIGRNSPTCTDRTHDTECASPSHTKNAPRPRITIAGVGPVNAR